MYVNSFYTDFQSEHFSAHAQLQDFYTNKINAAFMAEFSFQKLKMRQLQVGFARVPDH
jgi:hypothetical protein